MTDEPTPGPARTWMLIAALIVVVVIAWMLLSRGGGSEETAYEAGVTDKSGELIVTDPEEAGVPVELPETGMTNVPAEQPGAEPAPAAQ